MDSAKYFLAVTVFGVAFFWGACFAHAADLGAPPPLPPLPSDSRSAPPFPELKLPAPSAAPSAPTVSASNAVPAFPGMPKTPEAKIEPLPVPTLPGQAANKSDSAPALAPLPLFPDAPKQAINRPAAPAFPSAPSLPPVTALPESETAGMPPLPEPPAEIVPEPAPPSAEASAEDGKAKHERKRPHAKAEAGLVINESPRRFRGERLPESIYRKSYDRLNRHLPVAYYEADYDALVFATAAQNNLNGLRALLDSGRKVDLRDAGGETPLLVAVRHGAVNTARLLLARHADPQAADTGGATPQSLASQSGDARLTRAFAE